MTVGQQVAHLDFKPSAQTEAGHPGHLSRTSHVSRIVTSTVIVGLLYLAAASAGKPVASELNPTDSIERSAPWALRTLSWDSIARSTNDPPAVAFAQDDSTVSVDGSAGSPVTNGEAMMLDRPVEDLPIVDDARWSASLTGNTFGAVVVWVALLVLLQRVGAPITAQLLPRFPDRGSGFARLLALLASSYSVWILASLELIAFRAVWCLAALGILALVSVALVRAAGNGERARATAVGPELVFWAVFGLFLLFRFINPDSWHPLWGGEKPMEFAHINAILRSAYFPPYDPWYADGYVNYYYYGSYLVAFAIKLAGIPSELAFNLAQPTFIALIASGAYSLAAGVAYGTAGRRYAMVAGALGALLMVGVGNLDTAIRLLRTFPDDPHPDFFGWTWAASRSIAGGITEFPYFAGLYADLHAHVIAWPITLLIAALAYSLTQHPRAVVLALADPRRRRGATWLVAALLGALAITLGSLFATNAWDVPTYFSLTAISTLLAARLIRPVKRRVAATLVLSLGVGILGYVLFLPFHKHYVVLFGSLQRTRTQTDLGQAATHLGIMVALIAVGIVVQLLSLGGAGSRWFASVDPVIALGAIGAVVLLLSAGAWTGRGAEAVLVAMVAALVLAPTAQMVAARVHESNDWRLMPGALAAVALAGLLAWSGRPTLALALAFALAGAALLAGAGNLPVKFTGAMVAGAGAIVGGAELVFVVDDLAPDPYWYRMNTIFKFYNQVWSLCAVSASVLMAWMIRQSVARTRPITAAASADFVAQVPDVDIGSDEAIQVAASHEDHLRLIERSCQSWARAGVVLAAVAIAAGLLYPIASTRPRLELRFPGHPGIGTLNALDWMKYGVLERPDGRGFITFDGDLAAIGWLNEHVEGTPVIAEASIGPYRGNGSRISVATGLPAVLGWDRHERQQRYPEGIDERWADVRALYDSTSIAEKRAIIAKYRIEFIVLGDVERYSAVGNEIYASVDGIAALESMAGEDLTVVFESGGTTIYRVAASESSGDSGHSER